MSRYSAFHLGKHLDYRYKKLSEGHYAFYIGEVLVGQIFHIAKCWDAVSAYPNNVCPVSGFKTRMAASQFLLKLLRLRTAGELYHEQFKNDREVTNE